MEKIFYENEYVLWLEFDNNTNEFLNGKCELLDQKEIPSGIRPPHLTLAFVRCDNEGGLKDIVMNYFERIAEFTLLFDSLGIFPGGIVYYKPRATLELIQLHTKLIRALNDIGIISWDLYTSERWSPHVALTGPLEGEKLNTAISIMMEQFTGIKTEHTIVKLRKCLTGEEIVSYQLGM